MPCPRLRVGMGDQTHAWPLNAVAMAPKRSLSMQGSNKIARPLAKTSRCKRATRSDNDGIVTLAGYRHEMNGGRCSRIGNQEPFMTKQTRRVFLQQAAGAAAACSILPRFARAD